MSKPKPRTPAAVTQEEPANPTAERELLSACMRDPAVLDSLIERLGASGADTFLEPLHRSAYRALVTLRRAGTKPDAVTLYMQAAGELTAEQATIIEGASPTSANAPFFLRQVEEAAQDRRTLALTRQLESAVVEHDQERQREIRTELAGLEQQAAGLTFADWPDDWIAEAEKPLPWLIPDWLLRETVTILAADGGTGKSFLALALSISAVTGTDLFKDFSPTERTPVLFIDFENTARTVARRINGIRRRHALDVAHLTSSMRDRFHLVQQRGHFIEPTPSGRWQETALFRQLVAEARNTRPGLIVIDHLRRAGGEADGNDNNIMAVLIEKCDVLARESGGAVLVLAHTRKDSGKGKAHKDNVRGGGSITDEARCSWVMRRDDKGDTIALVRVKCNEAPEGATLHFRMASLPDHGVCIELVDAPPMQPVNIPTDAVDSTDILDRVAAGLDRFRLTMQEVRGNGPTDDTPFREFVNEAFGKKATRVQRIAWVTALTDSRRFTTFKEGKRDVLIRKPEYAGNGLFDANPDNPDNLDNPDRNPDCLGSATQTDGPPPIGGRNLSGFPSPSPIGAGLSRPSDAPSGNGESETNVVPFERPPSLASPVPQQDSGSGPLFGEKYEEPEDKEEANPYF